MWCSLNHVITNIMLNLLIFKKTKKGVPKLINRWLVRQFGSHDHILSFSCDWMHHKYITPTHNPPHNPRHMTISMYTIYHNISKHNITSHEYITSHKYITFITVCQTMISISRHNIIHHTNISHQIQYMLTSIYIYHFNIRYHNSRPFIKNSHHPDTFHPQTYLIRPITQIHHPIRTLHPHLPLPSFIRPHTT